MTKCHCAGSAWHRCRPQRKRLACPVVKVGVSVLPGSCPSGLHWHKWPFSLLWCYLLGRCRRWHSPSCIGWGHCLRDRLVVGVSFALWSLRIVQDWGWTLWILWLTRSWRCHRRDRQSIVRWPILLWAIILSWKVQYILDSDPFGFYMSDRLGRLTQDWSLIAFNIWLMGILNRIS